jgi:hypothetical protein
MPKIKRYFPVAHNFNRDPEIQDLRIRFGDWMGYVWQEFCSIGDRNDGIVPGTVENLARSMAPVSLWSRLKAAEKKIIEAVPFMGDQGWIAIRSDGLWRQDNGRLKLNQLVMDHPSIIGRSSVDHPSSIDGLVTDLPPDCIFVVNYAKYHKTWEPSWVLSERPNLPSFLPSKKERPDKPGYNGESQNKTEEKASESDVLFSKKTKPKESEKPLNMAGMMEAISDAKQSQGDLLTRLKETRRKMEQAELHTREIAIKVDEIWRRLIKHDKAKFAPLGSSIDQVQRRGVDNEKIAVILEQIEKLADRIVDPCGYFVAVVDRVEKNGNAAEFEAEHEARKKEWMH